MTYNSSIMEQDSQESWEGVERDPRESIGSSSTSKNGERRGSSGAMRPTSVVESRDSLQTESTQPKPLRETLKFDLTQPWQRSLLRDLEHIENSMLQEEEARPRPHADRVLLGHADSGDYLLECEDDISMATDGSSTCPVRLQVIHRHQFPMRARGRDESPEPDPAKFMDIRHSPKSIHDEIALSLSSPMPISQPTLQYLSHPNLDHTAQDGFRPIPHALPTSGRKLSRGTVSSELYRANAFSEEAKPAQAARILVEEEPSVIDYSDPACMCMGYASLIDLLLFNESPSVRKKKRRTSSHLESPPLSRRSSLGRVEEEEDFSMNLNPFCMPSQPYGPYPTMKDLEFYEHHQH